MALFHLIRCDHCNRTLYQTDGNDIRPPEGEVSSVRPVHLVIAKRLEVMFCSSECASKWIYSKPTEELLTGYPLF